MDFVYARTSSRRAIRKPAHEDVYRYQHFIAFIKKLQQEFLTSQVVLCRHSPIHLTKLIYVDGKVAYCGLISVDLCFTTAVNKWREIFFVTVVLTVRSNICLESDIKNRYCVFSQSVATSKFHGRNSERSRLSVSYIDKIVRTRMIVFTGLAFSVRVSETLT